MAPTSQTLTFDALFATTHQAYKPKMEDNVFSANPFFWWLKTGKRIRKQDGGANIIVPLMYGKNTTARSYSAYGTLDTSGQDGMTVAIYPWRHMSVSVSISGPEERKNSGKSQLIRLVTAKEEQAELSLIEEVDRQAFLDGSGNGAQDIFGLNLLVEDGAAWLSDVAGINRTTETWWRNQYASMTGQSFATNGLNFMRTMFNNCSKGNIHPTLLLTHQTIYEYYEKLLVPNERFLDTKMGDAGFQNLLFKAVPIVYDLYCPTQTMFFLNEDYIEFVVDTVMDFKLSEFVKPSDQDARIAQIMLYANLTMSNMARQGRLGLIDTA